MTPLPSLTWAVSSDPGPQANAATRTATRPVPTSGCSSSPTAWAATSPARSPRGWRSKRSRPSSKKPPAPTRTAPGRSRSIPRVSLEANRLKRRLPARQSPDRRPRSPTHRTCAAWRRPRRRSWSGRTRASVAHVGDSRVYVLRDGHARSDHERSLVGRGAGARRHAQPERRAPASVAQRRHAGAVGRRRSGGRRDRGRTETGRALPALFGRPVHASCPTSRIARDPGTDRRVRSTRSAAGWCRRPTKPGGRTTSRRSMLEIDAP